LYASVATCHPATQAQNHLESVPTSVGLLGHSIDDAPSKALNFFLLKAHCFPLRKIVYSVSQPSWLLGNLRIPMQLLAFPLGTAGLLSANHFYNLLPLVSLLWRNCWLSSYPIGSFGSSKSIQDAPHVDKSNSAQSLAIWEQPYHFSMLHHVTSPWSILSYVTQLLCSQS